MQIGFFIKDESYRAHGNKLAEKLHLPIIDPDCVANFPILLFFDEHGLGIKGGEGMPVYVDFNNKQLTYRRKSSQSELLARAVGIKKLNNPTVVDATAGLGQDSFILAALGCQVHMIERSEIVAALLEDGIKRGHKVKEIAHILERMKLHKGNAIKLLKEFAPDVIYLDPMFSGKTNSALVKKEMRIFREIVGGDTDAKELLKIALSQEKHRVVVKRPRKAQAIEGVVPTYTLEGSSCRFDVYLIINNL